MRILFFKINHQLRKARRAEKRDENTVNQEKGSLKNSIPSQHKQQQQLPKSTSDPQNTVRLGSSDLSRPCNRRSASSDPGMVREMPMTRPNPEASITHCNNSNDLMSLQQHLATVVELTNLTGNDVVLPLEQHSVPLSHAIGIENIQGMVAWLLLYSLLISHRRD